MSHFFGERWVISNLLLLQSSGRQPLGPLPKLLGDFLPQRFIEECVCFFPGRAAGGRCASDRGGCPFGEGLASGGQLLTVVGNLTFNFRQVLFGLAGMFLRGFELSVNSLLGQGVRRGAEAGLGRSLFRFRFLVEGSGRILQRGPHSILKLFLSSGDGFADFVFCRDLGLVCRLLETFVSVFNPFAGLLQSLPGRGDIFFG